MRKTKSHSLPTIATILLSCLLTTNPIHGKEFWLKCPDREGYLVGLDEKNRTYTINDWFFINNKGELKIGGDWFHGAAVFRAHQIEIVFTQTKEDKGKRYAWKKRFLISRIDLGYQEFDSEKIDDVNWSQEGASYNARGRCVITNYPGVKNKI